MKNIELLAPAGDFVKMKTALSYGADAVYVGGKNFGLRAYAGNFDDAELARAVEFVHAAGKKIFVTVNIFARNKDFGEIITYVKYLETIKVDAVIVSDLGVLRAVRENTNLEIHISTQANVVNKWTAEEYVKLGASRIILARELSLPEIKEIAAHLKGKADVEIFVHGAMCVSYSGRCLISNYLTGRDSNRGACAQPCRWRYQLVEEKRPNEYMPVFEDARGTYIMNSRDLCLINHLEELKKAGVSSFKIEGRMKSEYYVAGVVNAYRRALRGEKHDYIAELKKLSNRRFTTGFVFDETQREFYGDSALTQSHEFAAMVIGNNKIEQRNCFSVGDTLEILSPQKNFNKSFVVTELKTIEGEKIERAKRAQEELFIECPFELHAGDILRKSLNN